MVRVLYDRHRGHFQVHGWRWGQPERLDGNARSTIDAVLGYYGPRSAQWLSDLTHRDEPWKQARRSLLQGERGNVEIGLESMMDYYSSLPPDAEEAR